MADSGIGRGLAAILEVSGSGEEGARLQEIPTDLIAANPNQPRRRFDEDALQALADSVGQKGILQPVLVRPVAGGRYELVAGERRWRAAGIAGLESVPAIVEERDDAASLEAAIVENMARADLNPVEEARAVAALVEELGLTKKAVGKSVGRSRSAISNLLRILELPDEALALLEEGRLSEGHGKALLLAEDNGDRRRLARQAAEEGWSVRVLEDRARSSNKSNGKKGAKRGKNVHPDQQAACEEISLMLSEAMGAEVRVRPRGTGYKAEIAIDSLQEAEGIAGRVRAARLP